DPRALDGIRRARGVRVFGAVCVRKERRGSGGDSREVATVAGRRARRSAAGCCAGELLALRILGVFYSRPAGGNAPRPPRSPTGAESTRPYPLCSHVSHALKSTGRPRKSRTRLAAGFDPPGARIVSRYLWATAGARRFF